MGVVVCTHSDRDHASGLVQLLTHWRGEIREVWLPGQWCQRLEDLMRAPYEFIEELANDVADLNLGSDPNSPVKLENLLDLTGFERLKRSRERGQHGEMVDSGGGREGDPDLKSSGEIEDRYLGEDVAIAPSGWLIHTKIMGGPDAHRKVELFVEAVEAVDIIRQIARSAYMRGVRVRWFDYDEFINVGSSSGGDYRMLEPLNSREIKPRRVKVGALFYLALSRTNKRSLAFLSPEDVPDRKPGVLFTAESDFADLVFTEPRPSLAMIATAPHHGSESNKHAYELIDTWHTRPEKILWVRSNGQYNCRPGSTFLSKGTKMRLCTLCRPEVLPYQSVVLQTTKAGRSWSKAANQRPCSCC